MKTLIAVAIAAFAVAADAEQFCFRPREVPANSTLGKLRAKQMRKTGGLVVKPGSQKGTFLFLDAQDEIASSNITKFVNQLVKLTAIDFRYAKAAPAEVASGDWPAIAAKHKAQRIIAIVNNPKQPIALIALEDGWGLVNVAKLDRNLKTPAAKAKFIEGRARRELARVFTHLTAGVKSSIQEAAVSAPTMEAADALPEFVPADLLQLGCQRLVDSGAFTAEKIATYRQACVEGWAKPPTNDVQKAVWDELHALPAKPITIEPEKK